MCSDKILLSVQYSPEVVVRLKVMRECKACLAIARAVARMEPLALVPKLQFGNPLAWKLQLPECKTMIRLTRFHDMATI